MAFIDGTEFDDFLVGTEEYDFIVAYAGNDYIDAGEGNANITAGPGSDIIDFTKVQYNFANLFHWDLSSGIDAHFNIDSDYAFIGSSGDVDQIWGIQNLFVLTDGLFVGGTEYDDTFYINHTQYLDGQLLILPGGGVDSFYVDGEEGQMSNTRLMFNEAPWAVVIDLSLDDGQIVNDGYGNTETISGNGYIRQFFLTNQSDIFVGGDGNERIVGYSGEDDIDGGGGIDRIDFVGPGFSSVVVNLEQGYATGFFDSYNAGSLSLDYVLANIENVSGSGDAADDITGSEADNVLRGRGGDDTIAGLGGDDTLRGDEGEDFLSGGEGADLLLGGDDADVLIGGKGDDILSGGQGADCFVFGDMDGSDVIEDFEQTLDLIELSGTVLAFEGLSIGYFFEAGKGLIPMKSLTDKIVDILDDKFQKIALVSFDDTEITVLMNNIETLVADDFSFV